MLDTNRAQKSCVSVMAPRDRYNGLKSCPSLAQTLHGSWNCKDVLQLDDKSTPASLTDQNKVHWRHFGRCEHAFIPRSYSSGLESLFLRGFSVLERTSLMPQLA